MISDNLTQAGFSPQQARALTESIAGSIDDHAATKADLANLKADLVKWFAGTILVIVGVVVVAALEILSRLPNPS